MLDRHILGHIIRLHIIITLLYVQLPQPNHEKYRMVFIIDKDYVLYVLYNMNNENMFMMCYCLFLIISKLFTIILLNNSKTIWKPNIKRHTPVDTFSLRGLNIKREIINKTIIINICTL